MNRREFLKQTSAAIALAALPAATLTAKQPEYPILSSSAAGHVPASTTVTAKVKLEEAWETWKRFDPSHHYGNGVRMFCQPSPKQQDLMLNALYTDMQKHIPPPYRDLIQIERSSCDYGRGFQIAWRYRPGKTA